MDSHITGPAHNGYGSIVSQRGLRTQFGVTSEGERVLLKTVGATPEKPLIVCLKQIAKVAFDGLTREVNIISRNPDGSGESQRFTLADTGLNSSNTAWVTIVLTSDLVFSVDYTAGDATAGDVYSFATVAGLGELPPQS